MAVVAAQAEGGEGGEQEKAAAAEEEDHKFSAVEEEARKLALQAATIWNQGGNLAQAEKTMHKAVHMLQAQPAGTVSPRLLLEMIATAGSHFVHHYLSGGRLCCCVTVCPSALQRRFEILCCYTP